MHCHGWRSSMYFNGSDINNHVSPNGIQNISTHDNAFFFNEKDSTLYISYINISRIIKVKYPEGKVINVYGEIFKPGIQSKGNNLFCAQHCCMISRKGYSYFFNNNECN